MLRHDSGSRAMLEAEGPSVTRLLGEIWTPRTKVPAPIAATAPPCPGKPPIRFTRIKAD